MMIRKQQKISAVLLLLVISLGAAACSNLRGQSLAPTALPVITATGAAQTPPGLPASGLTAGAPQTFMDQSLGVSFTYPAGWQSKTGGRVEGADGYAWVETRATGGAGSGAICQGEANRNKPQTYGTYPEIQDLKNQNQPACLIRSSKDQPEGRKTESLYLLWYPAASKANSVLVLHADRAHIEEIGRSLAFTPPPPAERASACDYNLPQVAHKTLHQNGLRIDEYPVAQGALCSPYREPEAFNQHTESGPAAERAAELFNQRWSPAVLNPLNGRLAAYGFRIQTYRGASGNLLMRILQNGNVVRANISWLGELTMTSDRSNFILPLVDSYNATTYLLRPKGVEPIEDWDMLLYDNVFPVLVGQDLIRLAYENETYPRTGATPALLQVKKNGEVIDTLSVSGSTPAKGPVRGLYSWDGHWVLELPGLVVQDGALLNDTLGYSEMFHWNLFRDKPFYFYRKDGLVHLSYNGETLPTQYEQIIHEPQWTMTVLLQMKTYANGMVFYAQRAGVWYYVVIGVE